MSTKPLTESDLAALDAEFIVPGTINRILRGCETLDDIAEYTLHDMIGDLRPDTALLCIALCAQHIAAQFSIIPIAATLGLAADKIVKEYGPFWLANAMDDVNLTQEDIRQLLIHIPEDLESMADFLSATREELGEQLPVFSKICDILAVQAGAHKDYAEYELASLDLRPKEKVPPPQIQGGNVIMFPAQLRGREEPVS